jgi:hypothetical protein
LLLHSDRVTFVAAIFGKILGSLYMGEAVVGLAMCGALIGFKTQKWWKSRILSWFGSFRTWSVQLPGMFDAYYRWRDFGEVFLRVQPVFVL